MLILVLRENTRFMICRSARRSLWFCTLPRKQNLKLCFSWHFRFASDALFFNWCNFKASSWLGMLFSLIFATDFWLWSLVLTSFYLLSTRFSIFVYYYCWTFFFCICSESRTLSNCIHWSCRKLLFFRMTTFLSSRVPVVFIHEIIRSLWRKNLFLTFFASFLLTLIFHL